MSTRKTEIVPAVQGDASELARLLELDYQKHGYSLWDEERVLRHPRGGEGIMLIARLGGKLAGGVAAEYLPWDSEMLGVKTGRFSFVAADEKRRGLSGRLLRSAKEEAVSRGWQSLWLRVASTHDEARRAAERCRGEFIGTLSTFRYDLDGNRQPALGPGGVTIREVRAQEVDRLREVAAGAFRLDRYHRDPLLDSARVDALWAESIKNAVEGRAEAVLVAERGNAVAGFVTLHREENLRGRPLPGTGVIGLIAVAPGAKGGGLGRALVGAALRWFGDTACDAVEVGTQGDNLAAINLYAGSGFKMHRLWYDYRLSLRGRRT